MPSTENEEWIVLGLHFRFKYRKNTSVVLILEILLGFKK